MEKLKYQKEDTNLSNRYNGRNKNLYQPDCFLILIEDHHCFLNSLTQTKVSTFGMK